MRILHVITGLNRGGAETQLAQLLAVIPTGSAVFSLCALGSVGEMLGSHGIPVLSGGARGLTSLRWLPALRAAVQYHRPDVICGWMYHGNLAACAAAFGRRGPAVLWNIRHSINDLESEKVSTRWAIRAGAWLSALPACIVYNSAAAAKQHEHFGYRASSRIVVPNGFDIARFKPNEDQRNSVRSKLDVGPDERLVGVVGRAHPMKNHAGFVQAVALAAERLKSLRVVIVGPGVEAPENGLPVLVERLGLTGVVQLLPETSEPEHLYPAFDLLVSPSLWGEGFPNVVGEAMACAVPCLVTDVGDSAIVVGSTGFVAPSGEPEVLGDQLIRALSLDLSKLRALGFQARARIATHYAIDAIAARYRDLFQEMVRNP